LEGVWAFETTKNNFASTECQRSQSKIEACQQPGTQFYNLNQQFTISSTNCELSEMQFKCLGDWYVGKNHFFAVVNTRESRLGSK